MQQAAFATDEAMRRGHLPIRDDQRQRGRVSLVCVHCGMCASHATGRGRLEGTLLNGRCFPRPGDPAFVSARQREAEEFDAEEGRPWTAAEEASWAVRFSRTLAGRAAS
jgi:hypothetical protein